MDEKTEKIQPGFRFGKLEVIAPTDQRQGGYIIWRCRCACGNEVELDTRAIHRRTRVSCGCDGHDMSLKNQKIGTVTILGPAGVKDFECFWKCRCECGEEFILSQRQLLKGKKNLCPSCLGKFQNLAGKRFGILTVVERAANYHGKIQWKCRCDCGNEIVVLQNDLNRGKKKSCGCLQSQMAKKNLRLCEGTSVTKLEALPKKPMASNTSGYTGIYKIRRTGKWCAQITFKKKTTYLGCYATLEEAIEARRKGEEHIHQHFLEWYYQQNNSVPGDHGTHSQQAAGDTGDSV